MKDTDPVKIKPTVASDLADLKTVLDATGLFPPEMLDDMIAPFLAGQTDDALWLTCHEAKSAIGLAYAKPEALTNGTWNMLALAVLPERHGSGAGRALVAHLEDSLHRMGARILIVDTSGTEDFAPARRFYEAAGYEQEARIRDYWDAGDDKIIFRKCLKSTARTG